MNTYDRLLAIVAAALLVVGILMGALAQTAGGSVDVRDVRFAAADGTIMSALLFVPEGVSAENPAPGILAIHGYINSRETQSGFAIEFARRGYVVLELDQTGHGYSDPPAMAAGFGGPAGLQYLRSLSFVDNENIGLEGHSMGGWAGLIAAGMMPDAYKSVVIEGSSTGTFGAPEGTPEWPRNVAVVFSVWDEFSQLMWGVPVASTVNSSEKLMKLFGTDEPVEEGEIYGSIADGTARVLYQPTTTHPGDHLSQEAIGYAVSWFDQTLDGAEAIPANQQIWPWKEVGTLFILFAILLLVVPVLSLVGNLVGGIKVSGSLVHNDDPITRWVSLAVAILVPTFTFFAFQNFGNTILPANWLWRQNITTGIMVWALLNGAIALVVGFGLSKLRGDTLGGTGVQSSAPGNGASKVDLQVILRSVVAALITIFVLHLIMRGLQLWFNLDARFWVVALKPMARIHWLQFAAYLIPFGLFFAFFARNYVKSFATESPSAPWVNGVISSVGFAGLLLVQYIPLLAGGTLTVPGEPLLTIVAFQFVPLMFLAGAVVTAAYRRFGQTYYGAFVVAGFITWYIVAGQATHFGG
jgi:pimeloyl-ACP methyl ester carboxylesterase